jgi:hypothetical protein
MARTINTPIRSRHKRHKTFSAPSLGHQPLRWHRGACGKWHPHYRLRVPTRDPDAHQRLREARNLAARLVGSDRTASSLVHPLRWPGSWNRKAEPRMAQLIEVNEYVEIDLDETLDLLRQVTTEMGLEIGQDATNNERRFDCDSDDEVEAKAIAALMVIPNNLDYNDWINIGMEIHSAFGGSGKGRDLWHEFSRQMAYLPSISSGREVEQFS